MSQIATLLDGRIQYLEHDVQLWIVVVIIDADEEHFRTKTSFVLANDDDKLQEYIESNLFEDGKVNHVLTKKRIMNMFKEVAEAEDGGVW